MNELRGSYPDFNSNSTAKKMRLFEPFQSQRQKYVLHYNLLNRIVLFGKSSKEGYQLSSTSQDNCLQQRDSKPQCPPALKDKAMQNYKRIVIDLQKEFDEDQELLDLLEPKMNKSEKDQRKTGIRALFELKQSKIDMIPEEEEERLKQDTRILNYRERIVNNGKMFPNRGLHRKKHIDLFNSQDNNVLFNYIKNEDQPQISSSNDNNFKLNSEKERKEKVVSLSPPSRIDCNGCLITNEKNESPSTSGITHDSMKKPSIINSHIHPYIVNYNNFDAKRTNAIKYGYLTQKKDLMKTDHIPPADLPKKNARPLSNPHLSGLTLKKEDNLMCKQNIQGIINELMNKREFSHNDRKNQLGSAPSQSYNLNEPLFKYNYKSKEFSNSNINVNNLRQMHKIKIERGLASSKLIEKFSKQLSYDYTNEFSKKKNYSHKHNNEPIKIIKM